MDSLNTPDSMCCVHRSPRALRVSRSAAGMSGACLRKNEVSLRDSMAHLAWKLRVRQEILNGLQGTHVKS